MTEIRSGPDLTLHDTRVAPKHENTGVIQGFPHPSPLPAGEGDEERAPGAIFTVTETIADLQMRLAYQEDEIAHLNRVVEGQRVTLDHQAAEIEQLRRIVAALAETLRDQSPDARPPHY